MAGRSPLPIGTYGRITTRLVSGSPPVHEATTYYRDPDGVTRRVKARGTSRTAAELQLKGRIAQRRHNAGTQLTAASKVSDAAEAWLRTIRAQVEAGDKAPGTLANYQSVWRLHVAPALGSVRLREATAARCEAWMLKLRENVGPALCVTARAVLSAILGYAARMDAITTNPVRDISPIAGAGCRKRKPRALTAEQRRELLDWLDNNVAHDPRKARQPNLWHNKDEVIASRALGDIARFQLATGARIGEVMGLSWDEVDFEAGTVAISWHVVHVTRQGVVRRSGTKTKTGDRVLALPSWALSMLLDRRVNSGGAYPVFPSETGQWRDPGQILRWMRWSCAEAGIEWAGSHVFRQTVITELDKAGMTTRVIADVAGHAKLTQTQSYMARNVVGAGAAEALENII